MNKRRRIFAAVVIFFCFSHVTFADTVTITADEWCPYNCTPDTRNPGFLVEVAQEILSASGHTVVYSTRPWSRAVKDAHAGIVDGVVGTSKNDTPDFIFPEQEQGVYSYGVYVRADDPWQLKTLDSFKSRKIGVVLDYDYWEFSDYFKLHPNDPKIETASGNTALDQNIDKLLLKRVDTVLEDTLVMTYQLEKKNLHSKIKLAGQGRPNLIYIAFAPNNPKSKEYATLISNGMNTLRASGRLEKIMNKYGLHDWKK